MDGIFEQLSRYSKSDLYPFHMPGHKRNTEAFGLPKFYQWDITEIEGFDDLHHAEGILQQAMELAAEVYGAEETHFLVGGSTAGILSSILGGTRRGAKVLVARNCHKSVYHAIFMGGLYPVYLYPEIDEETRICKPVTVDAVRKKLNENPDIEAVILVSPTYEGVVSDIASIADAAHEKGVPLILDEAHGAHFGLHPEFPKNGNQLGADAVIHSLHKTMPSLTQSALLHLNGERLGRGRIREYLRMVQTSSPSYLLMGSMDYCIRMICEKGEELFAPYVKNLKWVREELNGLEQLFLWRHEMQELSKIVISATRTRVSGKYLYDRLLKDAHIQAEMAQGDTLLLMTAVGDTGEGFERLVKALGALDAGLKGQAEQREAKRGCPHSPCPMIYTSSGMAELADQERGKNTRKYVEFGHSKGYIAMEYLYLYPPGIPLVVPGEQITEAVLEQIELQRKKGYEIKGTKRKNQIEVWTNG